MQTTFSPLAMYNNRVPQTQSLKNQQVNSFWCYTVDHWEKNTTPSVLIIISPVIFCLSFMDLLDIWPLYEIKVQLCRRFAHIFILHFIHIH